MNFYGLLQNLNYVLLHGEVPKRGFLFTFPVKFNREISEAKGPYVIPQLFLAAAEGLFLTTALNHGHLVHKKKIEVNK